MKKHKISRDVKIVRYVTSWRISSKVSELFDRLGTITHTQYEIDAIYVYIHKDDEPVASLANLLAQVTPDNKHGEWETESAEVEKLVCGNCDYIDKVDGEFGFCNRYPPRVNNAKIHEAMRACGEHRLRE